MRSSTTTRRNARRPARRGETRGSADDNIVVDEVNCNGDDGDVAFGAGADDDGFGDDGFDVAFPALFAVFLRATLPPLVHVGTGRHLEPSVPVRHQPAPSKKTATATA
jgi:hypothetical protein